MRDLSRRRRRTKLINRELRVCVGVCVRGAALFTGLFPVLWFIFRTWTLPEQAQDIAAALEYGAAIVSTQ